MGQSHVQRNLPGLPEDSAGLPARQTRPGSDLSGHLEPVPVGQRLHERVQPGDEEEAEELGRLAAGRTPV